MPSQPSVGFNTIRNMPVPWPTAKRRSDQWGIRSGRCRALTLCCGERSASYPQRRPLRAEQVLERRRSLNLRKMNCSHLARRSPVSGVAKQRRRPRPRLLVMVVDGHLDAGAAGSKTSPLGSWESRMRKRPVTTEGVGESCGRLKRPRLSHAGSARAQSATEGSGATAAMGQVFEDIAMDLAVARRSCAAACRSCVCGLRAARVSDASDVARVPARSAMRGHHMGAPLSNRRAANRWLRRQRVGPRTASAAHPPAALNAEGGSGEAPGAPPLERRRPPPAHAMHASETLISMHSRACHRAHASTGICFPPATMRGPRVPLWLAHVAAASASASKRHARTRSRVQFQYASCWSLTTRCRGWRRSDPALFRRIRGGVGLSLHEAQARWGAPTGGTQGAQGRGNTGLTSVSSRC